MTPDPALPLVVADALVARLRGRVDGWAFEDMADQRDTLARLVEAEERAARPRGCGPWHDLDELPPSAEGGRRPPPHPRPRAALPRGQPGGRRSHFGDPGGNERVVWPDR
jgi:hypothetical protein